MKVLHTIASVNPDNGGPIEGVRQLAKANQKRGNITEIASLDPPSAPYLKNFPMPVHALGPGYLKYRYSRHFTPWLREHGGEYDVVIVNGIWQYHSFATWRCLRNTATPYVVFTHGMLDPWFKRAYPLKHMKKCAYWPWAEYRVLRDAQAVIFTCEEEKMLARQSFDRYSARERVVNYGTACPAGDKFEQLRVFFDRFPHLLGKRLMLFLGRIHPKKGCDLAIRSFAEVLGADPEWHLVMAGPDQVGWRSDLYAMAAQLNIADQITWTGSLSGDIKAGSLHAAEVFLLPSHQENFGIAVAEALACGLPVLISNKVNIWREVESDGAGLVSEDTLEGTTSLLRSWTRITPEALGAMRVKAARCFETRFEIQRSVHSLLEILEEVVPYRVTCDTEVS